MSQGTWFPLLCQAGVIALTTGVLAAGVSKGIERTTKILMPVLFVLLLACAVRSLTLPGALQGVKYLFAFDLSKLTGPVLLSAMGFAFFKLSLGMGAMTTYGSYLPESVRLVPNAVRVALADTGVSMLAGLAIFPGVFAFGERPEKGPGLLFETIPRVLGKLPLGNWFTVVFFVLAAIAATGAMVSLMEVPVAWLSERKKMSRPKAGMLVGIAMFGMGALATLSCSHVLKHVTIGGKIFFDLFDYVSSNFLLPLGGLGIAVLVGWFLPRKDFLQELDKGYPRPRSVHVVLLFFLKYLTPILIGVVFLSKIGVLPGK